MPDNREIATLILLLGVTVWAVTVPRVRSQVPQLVRSVFAPQLLHLWTLYVGYAAAIVLLAERLGLWEPSMLWATLVVVTTIGLPLLADAISRSRDSPAHHLKRRIFGASAIAGLYVNLATFSVPVELVLQVVGAFAGMMHAFAGKRAEYVAAARLSRGMLLVLGGLLIWKTTSHLIRGMSGDAWGQLGAMAALSLWFPVALLPLLYVLAYLSAAEVVTAKVLALSRHPRWSKAGWWFALAVAFRGRLSYVRGFGGDWAWRASRASSRRERRQIVAEYRRSAAMRRDGDGARV